MSRGLKKLLAFLLSVTIVVSGLSPVLTASAGNGDADGAAAGGTGPASELEMEDLDPSSLGVHKLGEIPEETGRKTLKRAPLRQDDSLSEVVRVSIFLEAPSALDAGYEAEMA